MPAFHDSRQDRQVPGKYGEQAGEAQLHPGFECQGVGLAGGHGPLLKLTPAGRSQERARTIALQRSLGGRPNRGPPAGRAAPLSQIGETDS